MILQLSPVSDPREREGFVPPFYKRTFKTSRLWLWCWDSRGDTEWKRREAAHVCHAWHGPRCWANTCNVFLGHSQWKGTLLVRVYTRQVWWSWETLTCVWEQEPVKFRFVVIYFYFFSFYFIKCHRMPLEIKWQLSGVGVGSGLLLLFWASNSGHQAFESSVFTC